jgi:prophage regulatory protein
MSRDYEIERQRVAAAMNRDNARKSSSMALAGTYDDGTYGAAASELITGGRSKKETFDARAIQELRHSAPSDSKSLRRTIRRTELRQIVPLADSTIYEMERRGEFPQRFFLTPRCVAWDLAEVMTWLDARRRGGSSVVKKAPPPDYKLRYSERNR